VTNFKLQTPNFKDNPSFKLQAHNQPESEVWAFLKFDDWSLKFYPCSSVVKNCPCSPVLSRQQVRAVELQTKWLERHRLVVIQVLLAYPEKVCARGHAPYLV